MGYVTCGKHGARCCWHCDACPKCSGLFNKVGRGDYCPTCTAKLKASGYVWSEYRKDYVTADQLPIDKAHMAESKISTRPAEIRTEQTPAGRQVVLDDTPARSVPSAPLKPKRAQTDKPLALEMPEIEAKEPELF